MVQAGEFVTSFQPGIDGTVDLVIFEQSDRGTSERVRMGFTPQQLDTLLTEGRVALYNAIGLSVN